MVPNLSISSNNLFTTISFSCFFCSSFLFSSSNSFLTLQEFFICTFKLSFLLNCFEQYLHWKCLFLSTVNLKWKLLTEIRSIFLVKKKLRNLTLQTIQMLLNGKHFQLKEARKTSGNTFLITLINPTNHLFCKSQYHANIVVSFYCPYARKYF